MGRDSKHIFSCSGDQFIASWDIYELKQEKLAVNIGQPVYSVLCIPSQNMLLAGTSGGALHVIDLAERRELRMITLHSRGVYDMCFDENKKQLIVAGGDGVLSIWSVPDFSLIRSIPLCEEKLRQMALSADGKWLSVACGDGTVRIFETDFFNELHTLQAHADGATAVAWHPSKPVLVSGGKDAHLKCWNISDNFREMMSIPAHNFAIYSIVFHAELGLCASASRDKTIKIWDSGTFDPIQKLDAKSGGHSHSVNKLLWLGENLISCGDDRKIIVWEKMG